MDTNDVLLMIERWAGEAGQPTSICCHTSRATGMITTYLKSGGALEHAQQIAAHQSPRTTKHYTRIRARRVADGAFSPGPFLEII